MKNVFFWVPMLALALVVGCSSRDKSEADKVEGMVLGDLSIRKQKELNFTEPADMAALNKLVEEKGGWIDNPLRSNDEVLYAYTNGKPAPMPLADALKLENKAPEDNENILATVERLPESDTLPPPNGEFQGVDYSASFSRHTSADVSTFNLLLRSTSVDLETTMLIGLKPFGITYDTFEPYASSDVNVSWQSSKDRLIDKIVLRDDITWSDGTPFTAYDIEFSYKVLMTSQVPIPAERSVAELLLGVKAYDERTVVFFHDLARPINLLLTQFPIIPKHKYGESVYRDPTLTRSAEHTELERNPVVAGPYVVEKRLRGNEIVFKRNEKYYMYNGKQVRTKPFFARVRMKISPETSTAFVRLKKGDIEVMQIPPELWHQTDSPDFFQKNLRLHTREWTYFAFFWNLSLPMFTDVKVREALDCAYDHAEMLKTCRRGLDKPCTGLFVDAAPWYPKEGVAPLKRDLERAKALLAEAGWKDTDNDGILDKEIDGKKTPFAFSMIVMNKPDRIEVCNLLKTNLREVGIDLTVQSLEFNVWLQKMQDKTFQASMGGWVIGSDPYVSMNIWGTDQPRNWTHYSNPEVDKLFKEGEVEFDREKRLDIYRTIHKLICADRPCTWLFCQYGEFAVSKGVRGMNFYPRCALYPAAWKPIPAAAAE